MRRQSFVLDSNGEGAWVEERRSSWRRVDKKKGTYRPFSMLWANQGGHRDPGAMTAALNIAKRCIAVGGTWLRFNDMSQRTEFLDLEVGFSEEFEQSWTPDTQWKKETTQRRVPRT